MTAMRTLRAASWKQTVVVASRGRVLEWISFESEAEAEQYKRQVRRWALEHNVLITVWNQEAVCDPVAAAMREFALALAG